MLGSTIHTNVSTLHYNKIDKEKAVVCQQGWSKLSCIVLVNNGKSTTLQCWWCVHVLQYLMLGCKKWLHGLHTAFFDQDLRGRIIGWMWSIKPIREELRTKILEWVYRLLGIGWFLWLTPSMDISNLDFWQTTWVPQLVQVFGPTDVPVVWWMGIQRCWTGEWLNKTDWCGSRRHPQETHRWIGRWGELLGSGVTI